MFKKILFLILLFSLAYSFERTSADVIPIKKPVQTKEETEKKLLIDILKPLPKPIKKTEVKQVEEKKVIKKSLEIGLILPKKKPLIAGKKKKTDIKISK